MISNKIDSGFYEKQGSCIPNEIIPIVCDEEQWSQQFKENSLDLIVSNCTLHWVNELESTLKQMSNSLEPDGVFISSMIGGDTLQELRICFNLAELERDGGVSPVVSPFLSLTEMGNTFSRC
jgi:NADH dehydrogenase [ubiquinone] 1 alpha subcomplex assembly factor 5